MYYPIYNERKYMNIVGKMVVDTWMKRYRKEMSPEEYKTWSKNFDETTIVRVDVDGVEFITRDYIKQREDFGLIEKDENFTYTQLELPFPRGL